MIITHYDDSMDDTPYIEPVPEHTADRTVEQMFREIREYFGFVPKLYRTLAHSPPLLQANWNKLKAVMSAGPLRREVKEAIAIAVSRTNDCEYCVRIHCGVLRRQGVRKVELTALLRQDLDRIEFLNEKEKALVRFVQKVNRSAPGTDISDFALLRQYGATDEEIIHALGVMEVYLAYNKLLVALRVQKEDPEHLKGFNYPPYEIE